MRGVWMAALVTWTACSVPYVRFEPADAQIDAGLSDSGIPMRSDWLYVIDRPTRSLERINPSTLIRTFLGPLGTSSYGSGDCAWNSSDSTLYAVAGDLRGNGLYRVSLTTGIATLIGAHDPLSLLLDSLAYHPPTNKLYGIGYGDGRLYEISAATGVANPIGATGLPFFDGLAWDSRRNIMIALNVGAGSSFYSVDVETGAITLIAVAGVLTNVSLTYDATIDRFWSIDTNGGIQQFDPSEDFAMTPIGSVGGMHSCIALVPGA